MNVVGQSSKDEQLPLTVDPASRTPIYAQLCAQIRAAIGRNALAPGQRLPTMRAVAVAARVDLNTVQKAYRELEHEGFLETRGARGTFVAQAPPLSDPSIRKAQTLAFAQATLAAARREGLDPKEVGAIIAALAADNEDIRS